MPNVNVEWHTKRIEKRVKTRWSDASEWWIGRNERTPSLCKFIIERPVLICIRSAAGPSIGRWREKMSRFPRPVPKRFPMIFLVVSFFDRFTEFYRVFFFLLFSLSLSLFLSLALGTGAFSEQRRRRRIFFVFFFGFFFYWCTEFYRVLLVLVPRISGRFFTCSPLFVGLPSFTEFFFQHFHRSSLVLLVVYLVLLGFSFHGYSVVLPVV